MHLTVVALFTFLQFSNAQSWNVWDITVTNTVTNTRYVCPCDDPSTSYSASGSSSKLWQAWSTSSYAQMTVTSEPSIASTWTTTVSPYYQNISSSTTSPYTTSVFTTPVTTSTTVLALPTTTTSTTTSETTTTTPAPITTTTTTTSRTSETSTFTTTTSTTETSISTTTTTSATTETTTSATTETTTSATTETTTSATTETTTSATTEITTTTTTSTTTSETATTTTETTTTTTSTSPTPTPICGNHVSDPSFENAAQGNLAEINFDTGVWYFDGTSATIQGNEQYGYNLITDGSYAVLLSPGTSYSVLSISQDITGLTPGANYQLSYSLNKRSFSGTGLQCVLLTTYSGDIVDTFTIDVDTANPTSNAWSTHSVPFQPSIAAGNLQYSMTCNHYEGEVNRATLKTYSVAINFDSVSIETTETGCISPLPVM